MDLSDISIALRRHWLVAAVAMVFWLFIGTVMALLPDARYRATATMLVAPSAEAGDSSVDIAQFQLPGIVAVLESNTFATKVRATLPERYKNQSVHISSEVPLGSGIVRLEVEGTDPDADAAWATALVTQILDESVADPQIINARVLDEAAVPSTPYSPKRMPIFLGTIVLGLISAVFSSAFVFRARKVLDVLEDIERRLGVPVIGRIPWVRGLRRASGPTSAEVLLRTPELTEAFQTLRTNLELAFMGTPVESQVVAVASWGEGAGKSTVAAGLALTSAQSGTEVLAVDADLRRPALHVRLGETFGPGTANVLRREPDGLVAQTRQPRLWMLPAGTTDRHPADVVGPVLERVLAFARGRHWRVVLDSPPYNGVAETLTVLSAARYVILVVDARRSRLPELESMATRLRASGVNIVGVALNRVPSSRMENAYGPYAPKAVPRPSTARASART
jgi:polysaccharide biosynthesis transport protein